MRRGEWNEERGRRGVWRVQYVTTVYLTQRMVTQTLEMPKKETRTRMSECAIFVHCLLIMCATPIGLLVYW